MLAAVFWGSLHNLRVGVSVTGCLRWGHGCGCPNVSVACVVQGAEGSSRSDCDRTAGWFLFGNWWRQRSCQSAAMAG